MAGSPMKSSNNGKKKAKNEKQSKSKKEWKIAKDRALLGTKAHESSDIPVQEDHGGSIAEEEERGPYDTELQDAIRRHSLREHDTVAYN